MRSVVVLLVVVAACGSPTPAPRPTSPPQLPASAERVLAFDHHDRKDARFPLLGQHKTVACVKCHVAGTSDTPLADPERCESCHATPHAAQVYGKVACSECHGPYSFAPLASFDHEERTRFTLGASHRQLACTTCHTKALGVTLPASACESCHAARAPHQDRFKAFGAPAACATCHAPSIEYDPRTPALKKPWKANRFDHMKRTGWQLTGKHAQVTCRACHRGSGPTQFEKVVPGPQCMGCHEHTRVHVDAQHPNGQFTNAQCRNCHFP